jgi:hypothetical protein
MQSGIPADRIRMSEGAQPSATLLAAPERRREGFWDWLFGTDIPERDRTWYETNLREGRTALSVLLDSEAERDRVVQMLEQFNPIDVEDTGAAVASQTGMAGPGLGAAAASQQGDVQGREEQGIPVVRRSWMSASGQPSAAIASGLMSSRDRSRRRSHCVTSA